MKKLFKLATITSALAFGSIATAQAADTIGFVDPQFLMQNHPLLLKANEEFAKFETQFAEEDKALAEESQKLGEEEKTLLSERDKLEKDGQALQREQKNLDAQSKKKMAELDKNTRLSTKMKQNEFNKALGGKLKAFDNKVAALQKREAAFAKKAEAFQKKAEAFEKRVADFQAKLAETQKNVTGGLDAAGVQKKVSEDVSSTIKNIAESRGYTVVLHPSTAMFVKDQSKDITEAVLIAMGGKMPQAQPQPTTPAQAAPETKPEEAKQ